MHIVVIAWLYVALMMAVAEATNTTGTVLGAVFTFLLYGVAPVALVVYLMNSPARRRRNRERELAAQDAARRAAAESPVGGIDPDAGREPAADAVPAVGKKT
jgi:prolyl-tRNA editing enzyme YbaK/EbsC (Cys-tRNA(Pro) deacylase)